MNSHSRLIYQEKYIKYLELELFKRMSDKEIDDINEFDLGFKSLPILYKIKMESLREYVKLLEGKLYTGVKTEDLLNIKEKQSDDYFPPYYTMYKSATINLYEDKIRPGDYSVILRSNGKENFGCALYLSNPKTLTKEVLGFLIEKMFYELLPLKFENLK